MPLLVAAVVIWCSFYIPYLICILLHTHKCNTHVHTTYTRTHAHMHTRTHAYTHAHMHAHTRTHARAHTHKHSLSFLLLARRVMQTSYYSRYVAPPPTCNCLAVLSPPRSLSSLALMSSSRCWRRGQKRCIYFLTIICTLMEHRLLSAVVCTIHQYH